MRRRLHFMQNFEVCEHWDFYKVFQNFLQVGCWIKMFCCWIPKQNFFFTLGLNISTVFLSAMI